MSKAYQDQMYNLFNNIIRDEMKTSYTKELEELKAQINTIMEENQKLKSEKTSKTTPKRKVNTTGITKKPPIPRETNQTKPQQVKISKPPTTTAAAKPVEKKTIILQKQIPEKEKEHPVLQETISISQIKPNTEVAVKRSNSTDLTDTNDESQQQPAKRLKSIVPPPLPELSMNNDDAFLITPIQSPPSDFKDTPESSPIIGSAFLEEDQFQLPPTQILSINDNNNENKEEEKEELKEEEKMEEEKQEDEEKEESHNQQKVEEKTEDINEKEKESQQQQQQKEISRIITTEKTNISSEQRKMQRMERFKEDISIEDVIRLLNKETLTAFIQVFNPNIISQVDALLKHSTKEIVNGLKKKFGEKNVLNFFKQYL